MVKRSRSSSRGRFSKRRRVVKRAPKRKMTQRSKFSANKRIRRIENMIETKESQTKSPVDFGLPHNAVTVVQMVSPIGADLNPFYVGIGPNDPMNSLGNRIGDKIALRGLLIKGFLENALQRAKVYYRIMLIKCAKGDTPTRATLFKGDATNIMIDQINTERFTVCAQKILNVSASNAVASSIIPNINGVPSGGTPAGIATRIFKMWVPGYKFGRSGILAYENNSVSQLKFFDYKLCIVAYDWYGTPQDVNTVGRVNELYTKIYFKDS